MTMIANEARHAQPGPTISRATLDHLREQLDDQRRTLVQRATEFVDDIEDLQTVTASSDVELGMTIALEANTLAAIEDIALALARMDDGSYGTCADCRVPIPIERLLALPQATFCVRCQPHHEGGV